MKRLALVTVFLAGAGLSALALEGCSGPSAPPGDAGFTPTATWGTGGSYGTNGSYGTGGSFGAGGAFGGGNQEREDGGGVQGDRRGDGGDQGAVVLQTGGAMPVSLPTLASQGAVDLRTGAATPAPPPTWRRWPSVQQAR